MRATPALAVDDLEAFFAFVEQVFQFRRKQLRSILSRLTGSAGDEVAERLTALNIDPTRRPETLGLEEWGAVYESFRAARL